MDADKELDELLAALAMVQISGAQQFVERKRRFLMRMRDDKAAAVSEERERCVAACESERLVAPTSSSDDCAYEMAIDDCIAAIKRTNR